MVKSVAVIGAGASGLAAIKCCLDEGLEPTCYERSAHIGGLWRYSETVAAGQASVMKSTVINTSKEMMCYSDYPIPREFAIFMHNKKVDEYLNMYADHFRLREKIQMQTEVLFVKPSSDYMASGRWDIRTKDCTTGTETDHVFDAVLVCTGHHAEPNMPTFPGMDKFKGKILHSHDYKNHHGYEDKRVLIVGIGNSGGDIAVELSKISSQVYLSTRRGSWVVNRVGEEGTPIDMEISCRFKVYFGLNFPKLTNFLWKKRLNSRFNHKKYALQPKHDPTFQHPMVNDDLPNRIIAGTVVIKTNVKAFTETSVTFEDGTYEHDIDAVILATGYVFGFPFLDKVVTEVRENQVDLYKYMFPPDLTHPSLAVIGCFQPLGAIMPISETQCRLATRVFKNDVTLPSQSAMWGDIRSKREEMCRRYVQSARHTIQVDYIPFMDELAELNGCKPNILKLMLTDPLLGWQCLFGPGTPYQYRLTGPGAWGGARRAIMTQWRRTFYPLKTRQVEQPKAQSAILIYVVIMVIGAILYYFVFV